MEEKDETVELLQKQVASEIEHNKILQQEKRRLEENIRSEIVKRSKMEQKVVLLEQELTRKERTWKVAESNFEKTISGLEERLERNVSEKTAIKILTATAFSDIVSSENIDVTKGTD